MENHNILQVRALAKTFGRTRALAGVDFDVRSGEVFGIIGPNGSGKTTLLECVAGLQVPDEGGVQIAKPNAAHDLFYLPDAITPWPDQRVDWLLRFFQRLYGATIDARTQLIDQLELRDVSQQRVGTLSKGQRKRLLLALGLLVPRPLLLFDEPFDGLDLRQTRETAKLLRAEAARGRTLLLSIHQLSDAARVCDRFLLLSAGSVVAVGTLAELRQRIDLPEASLEDVFLALT